MAGCASLFRPTLRCAGRAVPPYIFAFFDAHFSLPTSNWQLFIWGRVALPA